MDQYQYWDPETVIVEAKASGQSLLQEMRRMGIPVIDYVPTKGNDKYTRVNAVAPVMGNQVLFGIRMGKNGQKR
jgi:phage terminase large subunit-like protein